MRQSSIVPRRMSPNSSDTIARTSRMWIREEALQTNTPSAQPMIRITAIIYNSDRMVLSACVVRNQLKKYHARA
jgi:hypothetical protein